MKFKIKLGRTEIEYDESEQDKVAKMIEEYNTNHSPMVTLVTLQNLFKINK